MSRAVPDDHPARPAAALGGGVMPVESMTPADLRALMERATRGGTQKVAFQAFAPEDRDCLNALVNLSERLAAAWEVALVQGRIVEHVTSCEATTCMACARLAEDADRAFSAFRSSSRADSGEGGRGGA